VMADRATGTAVREVAWDGVVRVSPMSTAMAHGATAHSTAASVGTVKRRGGMSQRSPTPMVNSPADVANVAR
jgi:hypothetical protein